MGARKQIAKLLAKIPKISSRRADQAAALCWRVSDRGSLEILLVTSRDTGRWVIPKGSIRRRESTYRAAQREAFEEAGVSGKIRKTASGYYEYVKDDDQRLVVVAHLLKAINESNDFPERAERQRLWVAPTAAASMVDEAELKEMLIRMDERTVLASQDRQPPNREMVKTGRSDQAITVV